MPEMPAGSAGAKLRQNDASPWFKADDGLWGAAWRTVIDCRPKTAYHCDFLNSSS